MDTVALLERHSLQENLPYLRRVIILDVDGVLLDTRHRIHHIVNVNSGDMLEAPDWLAYEREREFDTPLPAASLLDTFLSIADVVLLTARPNSIAQVDSMVRLLNLKALRPNWYLQLRDNLEQCPVEYKRSVVQNMKHYGIDILFAIDDSQQQCLMYRGLGICALRCMDTIDAWNHNY